LAGSATHSPLLQIHSQRRGNLAPLAFNVIPKKLYNADLPNQRGVISDNAVLKKECEKTNHFAVNLFIDAWSFSAVTPVSSES
jgi:hypothetical protein